MKKCAIITSYIEGSLPQLLNDYAPDIILCADGGYDHAQKSGIIPDYLIGDFDSITECVPPNIRVITFPPEKDDTDTGLCIQTALDLNCDDILIIGGLGGRFDHATANIQLMAGVVGKVKKIAIKDQKNYCMILKNSTIVFSKNPKQHLSVLSLSDVSQGVTISGVKYPLSNYTLKRTFPLGVSNEFDADQATVSVTNGTLLVILSEDC